MKHAKPTIAIDIDDVLAAGAEGFVRFSNERWGTNLTVGDYQEHWVEMWQVDVAETERRSKIMHDEKIMNDFRYLDGAYQVLVQLRKKFHLVVVTSRRLSIEQETRAWLDEHYHEVIDEVVFANIFEGKVHLDMYKHTKADTFDRIGAQYVIDDQLKHCLAAAELGLDVILFGDYAWNQSDQLPSNVTRCRDWAEVRAYFGVK